MGAVATGSVRVLNDQVWRARRIPEYVIDATTAQEEQELMRRERLYRQAAQRSSKRRIERSHKAGSARFVLLVLVLLATAVLVTVAMFRALYIVMG